MIKECAEYHGRWWKADSPSKVFYGKLQCTPSENRLVLEDYQIDMFQEMSTINNTSLKRVEIILGETIDNKPITLLDCIEKSVTVSGFRNKKTSYYVSLIFLGNHYIKPEDIVFTKCYVSFTNLDEWANISGFKFKTNKNFSKYSIIYKRPKSILLYSSKKVQIRITYDVKYPTKNIVQKEATIAQAIALEFKYPAQVKLHEIMQSIQVIQDLLSFSLQTAVFRTRVRLYNEELIKKTPRALFNPTELVSLSNPFNLEEKNPTPFDMLLTLGHFYPNQKNYLKKWFKLYYNIQPTLQFYFTRYYNPRMYLEYQFLNIIQVIEGYHRIRLGGRYIPNGRYHKTIGKEILNSIPKSMDKDFRESLKSKIYYGNEYSLRKRLKELINKIPAPILTASKIDNNKFVHAVCVMRNEMIHQDKDSKKKQRNPHILYSMTHKLTILFEILLLKELGFEDGKLDSIMQQRISRLRLE